MAYSIKSLTITHISAYLHSIIEIEGDQEIFDN